MNRILIANVYHTGNLFGGEFGGQSGVFQWDNGLSYTSSRVVCTSATFGNGWAACEAFNEATK